MKYNWQQPDWPDFSYDLEAIEDALFAFSEATGHITGILKTMPANSQQEAIIQTMVAEAVKTSAIEGEFISRQDVMSSIRKKLGLVAKQDLIKDKRAKGAGELMVDVRKTYKTSLTKDKLFDWHHLLMAGQKGIHIGKWRKGTEPMQVISGTIGKEIVHFEAPPSKSVPKEMEHFLQWFNATAPGGNSELKKAPVRAAIAHLYFESIHPFEDGNGRIGRAIAEKALAQTLDRPILLSLSRTIEVNKKAYYNALKKAQRDNDITDWIKYFTNTLLKAQQQAIQLIEFTLQKTKLLDGLRDQLNERQLKALLKMLDAGPDGFVGGMTAKKYISITRTSKATATRDLQELVEMNVLLNAGGGRSTHYMLAMK